MPLFSKNSGSMKKGSGSSSDSQSNGSDKKKHHKSPLQSLKAAGDKLRPHTAVTSTTEQPGASSNDRPAGTSVPIASRANPNARNAGLNEANDDNGPVDPTAPTSADGVPSKSQSNVRPHSQEDSQPTPPDSRGNSARDHSSESVDKDRGQEAEPTIQERAEHQSGPTQKVMQKEDPSDKHAAPAADGTTKGENYEPESMAEKAAQNPDDILEGDNLKASHETESPKEHHGSKPVNIESTAQQKERLEQVQQELQERGDENLHLHATGLDGHLGKPGETAHEHVQKDMAKAAKDVPGMHVGTDDPGLPGHDMGPSEITKNVINEDKEASRASETPSSALDKKSEGQADAVSENVDKEKVLKKFGTIQDELADRRARQSDYTGWRQVAGWDKRTVISDEEAQEMLQRSTLLEEYIKDKYFGDWYQNTCIILGTAVLSFLLGHYHFSFPWLTLVLLTAGSVYRTSIRRLRRNYRDDVVRQVNLEKIDDAKESMEWLNAFLVKFWLIYEPSLSLMITQIANEILKEQTPGFIDSLSLKKFTLGTKAPRIEFVRSFPKTDPDVAVMDWSASFTPNDVLDLTARQLKNKVNPKIQLNVRVGKGFVGQSFPILVEDMSFRGTARLRMKMMPKFPHIQTVDVSLLEPPEFDFSLKPIGGDKFGFDIVKTVPGLSKFIKEMVHANLGPMLYAPNAFQVNLEQLMAGVGVMSGVGILSVNIRSAKNLKKDARDGTVDPYVRLMDSQKKEQAHTKIKANTAEPVFNEVLRMIITNTTETQLLEILDFNEQHNDRVIGTFSLPVAKIADGLLEDIRTECIISGGNKSGEITFSAYYAPVQMATADENGDIEEPRDTKAGILNFTVVGARNLDAKFSKVGQLSTYCEIEFDGKLFDTSRVAKSTNSPDYSYNKETIIINKAMTQAVFRIRQSQGKQGPQVGTFRVGLQQLLLENQKEHVWFPLEPPGSGEIQIQTQWKPVVLADGSGGDYIEPVGVARLTIKHADDLRNLEHIGKIDPYVRFLVNKSVVGRTSGFSNNLNPVWNEVHYVPIQNELQTLTLEVMDSEKRASDRSLGSFSIDLSKIMTKDAETNKYKTYISDKEVTNRLVMPNRGPKGTLTYAIEFFPAIPIVAPSARAHILKEKKHVAELEQKEKLTDEEKADLETRRERLQVVGVDMPVEEQLEHKAGVFAFSVDTVTGVEPGQRLRVTADNKPFTVMLSRKARGKRLIVNQSGDTVTGQFPLSSLRFQMVNAKNENDPSAVDREIVLGMQSLLREAYGSPKAYKFGDGEITLSARFFPLPELVIGPEEDISDSGCVEVMLYSASGVRAADSSGTSDPYTSFHVDLHKERIYKSTIVKKTLDPVWNERFRFDVDKVHGSELRAIVWDWDMGNKDDFLGGVAISFDELEPLVWKDFELELGNVRKGKETGGWHSSKHITGTIKLALRFDPGVVHIHEEESEVGKETVTKVGQAGHASVSAAVETISHGPSKVLGGILGRKSIDSSRSDYEVDSETFSVSIEMVKGVTDVKEVQLRAFLVGGKERELFKSRNVKVQDGDAEYGEDVFEVSAPPGEQIGFKLRSVKGLGRHSEIGQGTAPLTTGRHEIDFGAGERLIISIHK